MAAWVAIEAAAPDLAAEARRYLDSHVHKTLATLRRDGSPRISGTECKFALGELWFGSMAGALKAQDLMRDPRFALHSGSDDPPDWDGDAKVAGRAVEITDPGTWVEVYGEEQPQDGAHLFRADLFEVSTVRVGDGGLVIASWHEGRGVSEIRRS
jgi:hypothetical protein